MTHELQAFRITITDSWLTSSSFLASETSLSCKETMRGQGGHIYLLVSATDTLSQRGCLLRLVQHKHINNTLVIACTVCQGLDITSTGSTLQRRFCSQPKAVSDIILMGMSSTVCPRHHITMLVVGSVSTTCTTHGVTFCASTC